MASNCDFDEELSCSTVERKLETNETDAPGSSNTKERKYKCPQCPKQYKYSAGLSTHVRIHDEKKRFICQVCQGKIFATKLDYDRHMVSHTGEKKHECPTCKCCFGLRSTLKNHQYLHLKKKTFKCPICAVDRYFQSPVHLSNHMIRHTKEKPHDCFICHKEFHVKADLQRHERVHSKERPFQCGICQKCFGYSVTLKTHIRAHLGETPYKCEICDKGFVSSGNCQKHQKNCERRMAKRQHKCMTCPKRYSNKETLTNHMKIHNKETTN